jgi:hypothetical protein
MRFCATPPGFERCSSWVWRLVSGDSAEPDATERVRNRPADDTWSNRRDWRHRDNQWRGSPDLCGELQRVSDGFRGLLGRPFRAGVGSGKKCLRQTMWWLIKMPPGLTCDATRKVRDRANQSRTVVNFACFGDVKGSIVGFATNEFGTFASARVTLTAPLTGRPSPIGMDSSRSKTCRPGEYLLGLCKAPVSVDGPGWGDCIWNGRLQLTCQSRTSVEGGLRGTAGARLLPLGRFIPSALSAFSAATEVGVKIDTLASP